MESFALALVLTTALGLLFVGTRWLGVAAAFLLAILYPFGPFAALVLAGIFYCFIYFLKGKHHDL